MLSYQHQYHAGNFADVHKHLILRVLFESLLKKEKPFNYIDCHAGSGIYDLESREARKTAERSNGIDQIWLEDSDNETVQTYLEAIRSLNTNNKLRYYPGSPKIASLWMRDQDRAQLIELHPKAQNDLRRRFTRDKRFSLHNRDCYEGLPAIVPPQIKRGLVLLDPSYEEKNEYHNIVDLVIKSEARWATATYAIWYPLLTANRHQYLIDALKRSSLKKVLISEITINDFDHQKDAEQFAGMYGSGMAIINAPWQLDEKLDLILPKIAQSFSADYGKSKTTWLRAE
ncbi:MAG: 23S rRNA (adenine2030-N6)-methyltransferase [Enterobacterales bacterium]|jgi:23S rRNA (adenine2030-N6)-methyltransferase